MVIHRPLKPYAPKHLVHGFCVPSGSREKLICGLCHLRYLASVGPNLTPVTYDGRVNCADCGEVL